MTFFNVLKEGIKVRSLYLGNRSNYRSGIDPIGIGLKILFFQVVWQTKKKYHFMQNYVWGNKVRYYLYVLEGGRLTLEAYISESA